VFASCLVACEAAIAGDAVPTWQQIEGMAVTGSACQGDSSPLHSAQEELQRQGRTVRPLVDREIGGPLPEREVDEFPSGVQRAVGQLLEWQQAGGGFSAGYLQDKSVPLALFALAKVSLATAHGPAGPDHVEAVLQLGAQLRQCGGAVHQLVGISIADAGLATVQARGLSADDALRRHRPAAEESFHAMVRDSVWTYRMVEGELTAGPVDEFTPAEMEEELAMLRTFYIQRIGASAADPADLELLEASWAIPLSEQHAASALIETTLFDPGGVFRGAATVLASYAAYLEPPAP